MAKGCSVDCQGVLEESASGTAVRHFCIVLYCLEASSAQVGSRKGYLLFEKFGFLLHKP